MKGGRKDFAILSVDLGVVTQELLSHKDRDGKSHMWPREPPFTNICSVIPKFCSIKLLHGERGRWGDEQIALAWQLFLHFLWPKHTRCLTCNSISSPVEESLRSRRVSIATTGVEPSLYSEYCWSSCPGPIYWKNESRKCVYLLYMCPIYNWTHHYFLFVLLLIQEKQQDDSLWALVFGTKWYFNVKCWKLNTVKVHIKTGLFKHEIWQTNYFMKTNSLF